MARPHATKEQRAAQRQRIRDAARKVYDADGIDAVTVRRVAEEAGVSQGTIYSYFENHVALVRSLWLAPIQDAGDELETIASEIEDPVVRLRALLTYFYQFVIDNPDLHRRVLLFVRKPGDLQTEPQPLDQLPFYRTLRETLEDLQLQGRLAVDHPHRVAEILWAALHGSLGLSVNADIYQVTKSDQLGTEMLEFLINAILTPEESG